MFYIFFRMGFSIKIRNGKGKARRFIPLSFGSGRNSYTVPDSFFPSPYSHSFISFLFSGDDGEKDVSFSLFHLILLFFFYTDREREEPLLFLFSLLAHRSTSLPSSIFG